MIEITIRQGKETLTGTGDTAYEALASIKRPAKITGKTFLSIKNGEKKAEKMYMPMAAKRLFYPIAQAFLAKQLEFLVK